MTEMIKDGAADGAADPSGTYRRLLRYAKPYTGRLVIGIVCGVIFAGSQTALLPVLKDALEKFFSPETMSLHAVLVISLLLLAVTLLRGIGFFLSVYMIQWVGNRVVYDLRKKVFSHLVDSPLQFFAKNKTGELISRSISDTQMVERAVSTVLGDLARQPFVLLGTIGYLLYLKWDLALVTFVVFPICILPVSIFGKRVRRYSREGQSKLADLASIIHEVVFGVKVVKAFGMEPYENTRFGERARDVFSRIMKVTRAQASIEPIIVFISVVGIVLVMFYAYLVRMELPAFFTFTIGLIAMYEPVKRLGKIHLHIQHSSASADRIFEILDTELSVKDRPDAVELNAPIEKLSFNHVHFGYNEKLVLKDVQLDVKHGECIALVGSSGSGKTTLVNLIPRFFDVNEGSIAINGQDIRSFTMKSLRRQMGIVTQETILFNDSVTHNITYGSDDVSMEQVVEAAQKANADRFIRELSEGYDTVIGERGVSLSGGQCQRLSIARAILRNPAILILDEATNALDAESERVVQEALDVLMKGRTVFVIAHRLSTIVNADRILVMDEGRIVEQGTHHELLALGGQYKYLHDLQFDHS